MVPSGLADQVVIGHTDDYVALFFSVSIKGENNDGCLFVITIPQNVYLILMRIIFR